MPWKKIKKIFQGVQEELTLSEEELEAENRLLEKEREQKFTPFALRVLIKTGLYLVVLLSMMPIIGFYGGILGLIIFAGFIYYLKANQIAWKNPYNRFRRGWVRLAFYAVLFGLVAHAGCKIHSSLLVAKFQQECREEKSALIPNSP